MLNRAESKFLQAHHPRGQAVQAAGSPSRQAGRQAGGLVPSSPRRRLNFRAEGSSFYIVRLAFATWINRLASLATPKTSSASCLYNERANPTKPQSTTTTRTGRMDPLPGPSSTSSGQAGGEKDGGLGANIRRILLVSCLPVND